MGEAVERPVDHHVERHLGLGDPAHAVRQPGRPEAVLPQHVTLAPPAEHGRVGHPQVLDEDLGVAGGAVHGLDLAHLGPTVGRDVDEERRVARLRQVGIVLGAGQEDGELGAVGVGDEPLVAVDHPLVAVLVGVRADQRGVRPGHLGLGHGEAAHRPALAQRPEVALLLLVGGPVEQRVHVALVGRHAVEHERPEGRLGRLGLHHRQLDVPEAHAAPLGGHVRQPQPHLPGLVAHGEERLDVVHPGLDPVEPADLLLAGPDHVVDELTDPQADGLELRGEGEVDAHGAAPMRERARANSPRVMACNMSPMGLGALPAQARA